MNPLEELLFEVKLALPEAYESYLDGEGDQRQRLHGLRFDIVVEIHQADDAGDYGRADIYRDFLERLDAELA